MKKYIYEELTEKIIGAAYTVHNNLGFGFLEKVYQNSLLIELDVLGISAKKEVPIKVYYKNTVVGDYFADIVVDQKIILEIKSIKKILPIHEVQLLNYLKATNYKLGLLINFGSSVEVKRKIL